MKTFTIQKNNQKGFTLVETLIAIFILTVSISAMMNLAAGSFFSVRYARNDIVASNLTQEAIEYIRNARDSAYLAGTGDTFWSDLQSVGCFANGCTVDPYNKLPQHFFPCPLTQCQNLSFFGNTGTVSFYGYNDPLSSYDFPTLTPFQTTYIRSVKVQNINGQYIISVTLSWLNGISRKSITQSLTLTDWNI